MHTFSEGTVEESEEEDLTSEDSDNMDTMDTVIQKQFQEMMKRGIKPSKIYLLFLSL